MKIDIALHSCDSNPLYLDFWPLVSKVWRLRMGVEPVLIYIDENHDIPIDTTYGRVLKLKPTPGVPLYIQAVWGRFWGATLFPDKVCIVSDIDMFPVSRTYFIRNIESIPDTKYVHLFPPQDKMPPRPTGLVRKKYFVHPDPTFPVCYHVGKGAVLSWVLKLNPDWNTSVGDIAAHPFPADQKYRPQWGIDEAYTSSLMRAYPDQSIFTYCLRPFGRIDRSRWAYAAHEIKNDDYGDCHSVRPLSDPENRRKVNELMALLV